MRPIALLLSLTIVAVAATAVASYVLGDIYMDRASTANGVPAVVFPHWRHRSQFRCYACHPNEFEMRAGANEITMDDLRAGRSCGRCHDGRVAFAVGFDTCRTCHSSAGR
jgi:c(7)-type cytochrome triheme protein